MSLDETIKYIEEQEKAHLDLINSLDENMPEDMRNEIVTNFKALVGRYHQLAEWLKALKEIWDSGDCNDCRNGQCEWKPRLGQLVRYNCPHYVGIANEEVKADE